jgi:hypothetical protein
VSVAASLPTAITLMPNYPNPFNSTTTIPFSVRETGRVRLTVHTMLGQEIGVLFDDVAAAGEVYRPRFEAETYASGTYICRLQGSDRIDVRRISLIR